MNRLREPFLEAGLRLGNFIHASGEQADNKLELDFETVYARRPGLAYETAYEMGTIALRHGIDLLVPVPYGANGYARLMARRLEVRCLELAKDPNTRDISYPGEQDELDALLEMYHRIGIVEDVPNALTSVLKVMHVLGGTGKIKLVVGAFNRGNPNASSKLRSDITFTCLVNEHIPATLGPDHYLRRYAQ